MLHVKTDVETAEKTKLFRFEIRNFLLVGAEIVVDFFCFRNRFPTKIETSRKGYGFKWLIYPKGVSVDKIFYLFCTF